MTKRLTTMAPDGDSSDGFVGLVDVDTSTVSKHLNDEITRAVQQDALDDFRSIRRILDSIGLMKIDGQFQFVREAVRIRTDGF